MPFSWFLLSFASFKWKTRNFIWFIYTRWSYYFFVALFATLILDWNQISMQNAHCTVYSIRLIRAVEKCMAINVKWLFVSILNARMTFKNGFVFLHSKKEMGMTGKYSDSMAFLFFFFFKHMTVFNGCSVTQNHYLLPKFLRVFVSFFFFAKAVFFFIHVYSVLFGTTFDP